VLKKVKAVKDGIVIAGGGRHDIMGHCVKYGACTIFCCTIPIILHFSLIQVKDLFLLQIQDHLLAVNLKQTGIIQVNSKRP